MSADDVARLVHEPASVKRPMSERAWTDAPRNDPVLRSRWGPGDPDLAVARFHFTLSIPPKPLPPHDGSAP
jgi:hypothetical protein